jgi:hypothetical protein
VQGFLAQSVTVVAAAHQVVEIELHLNVVPMRVRVNVGGTTPLYSSPRPSEKRWKR